MVGIIDYKVGNIGSIINMLQRLGVDSIAVKDATSLTKCKSFILPGVGAFDEGMYNLKNSGMLTALEQEVMRNKKPLLGICLGMQLLTNGSEEGQLAGLGWFNANTKKFAFPENSIFKIPHMGWDYIEVNKPSSLLNSSARQRFYFVHSYYVECEEEQDILASCTNGVDFTCAISHDQIYGVQFHPEKSHRFGMEVLQNFCAIA